MKQLETFEVGELVEIYRDKHHLSSFGVILSEGKFHLGQWYDVYNVNNMKTQIQSASEISKVL